MLKLVVLCSVAAAVSGSGLFPFAPLAYSAPLLAPWNYRGPLSLAPGQPANIIAADGRPLDTLDVNLDRSAHYTAKALEGSAIHLLKKRSVVGGFVSPIAYSAPLFAPYNYRGPLSLAPGQPAKILGADGRPLDTLDVNLDRSAHLTAKALSGVHLLKKRSAVLAAPLTYHAPLAYSTHLVSPIAPITRLAPIAPIAHLPLASPFAHALF